MKIAVISYQFPPDFGIGGVGVYSSRLAYGLSDFGHEVHVIAHTNPDDAQETDIKVGKVVVHRIHEPKWSQKIPFLRVLLYRWRIRMKAMEIYLERGLDVIEAPNWVFEGLLLAMLPFPVPLITRMHTPMFEHYGASGHRITFSVKVLCLLEKIAVLFSDGYVTSTTFYAKKMSDAYGIPLEKINIVPLGVELPERNQISTDSKREIVKVLFVGRLEDRKGTKYLLKAIPVVLQMCSNVSFTFIGKDFENNHQRRFEEETQNIFKDKVFFLGFVDDDDLKDYYRDCDIFVVPSLSESFGLIFVEAMSWAKPVIACDVCGISDVVKHFESGILVRPKNEYQLAEALAKLINDKDLRQEMGRRGREICEQKFEINFMVQNMVSIYLKHLNAYDISG